MLFQILVLLVAFRVKAEVPADYPPRDQRITSYACENSFITLRCTGEGERIRILLANYGRFSLVICNQNGVSKGWNLNCVSMRSTDIVESRCSGHQNCTVYANDDEFGDPCPGTKKYIEIRYFCEKVSSGYNKTSTSTSTVTTAIKTGMSTELHTEQTTPTGLQTEQTTSTGLQTEQNTRTTSNLSTTQSTTAAQTSQVVPSPTYSIVDTTEKEMCASVRRFGIFWNMAAAGKSARQYCPGNLIGFAMWKCGQNSKWIGEPDLSNCVSPWLEDIQTMLSSKTDLITTMKTLNTNIQSKTLVAGDLKKAFMTILPKMVDRVKFEFSDDMSPDAKREMVHGFSKEIVKSGSSLLQYNKKDSWNRLDAETRKKSATSLIIALESMAKEVATTIGTDETVTSTEENIVMEVSVLELSTKKNLQLPRVQTAVESDSIQPHFNIPLDGIRGYSLKDEVDVTYLFYNNLDSLMNPEHSLRTINSNVISATVSQHNTDTHPNTFLHLSTPMNYTVPLKKTIYDERRPVCVYWSYNESSLIGDWSDEGCYVVSTTDNYTTCQCDHLTNFAVLMDVTGTKLNKLHVMSLQAITYVGCTVSIICLVICLISFCTFRNLQSDRNTIHKNLVVCLLVAEILFLFGIGKTEEKILCSIIAGFLHLFFLASFCWMCLEGIQLYFMLIVVFEAERYKWFYLFGYGVPALIVGISAAVDHTGYGTELHCWLQTDNYFILSFVIPAALVIMINFVMLSVAIYTMCRHAGVAARKKTKLERIGTWLKGSSVLVVLLGLTWTFGLLYVNEDTVVLAYLFTILNSLQGLFIFVFHCFMDKKVKKEWRRAIYKAKWLPMCCRVNLGVTQDTVSSPTPSYSSGIQNYFLRLWSSRKRKRSTTSTSAKNRRSDMDSFLHTESSSGCTTRTGLNRYSNQSDRLLPNGQNVYTAMPTHDEGGVRGGDLSVIDCSVVDSENVTEYCQQLNVSNDQQRFSSDSEDEENDVQDRKSQNSTSRNRLSFLSVDSDLKGINEECTSENEFGENSYAMLDFNDSVLNDSKQQPTGVDHNCVSGIEGTYENTKENTKHSDITETKPITQSFKKGKNIDTDPKDKVIKLTQSDPNINNLNRCKEEYSCESGDTSTHPLLGSMPNVSAVCDDGVDLNSSLSANGQI